MKLKQIALAVSSIFVVGAVHAQSLNLNYSNVAPPSTQKSASNYDSEFGAPGAYDKAVAQQAASNTNYDSEFGAPGAYDKAVAQQAASNTNYDSEFGAPGAYDKAVAQQAASNTGGSQQSSGGAQASGTNPSSAPASFSTNARDLSIRNAQGGAGSANPYGSANAASAQGGGNMPITGGQQQVGGNMPINGGQQGGQVVQMGNGQYGQVLSTGQVVPMQNGQMYPQQGGYGMTQGGYGMPQQQGTDWGKLIVAGGNLVGAATGKPVGNLVGAAASGYSIYSGADGWSTQDSINALNIATNVAAATNKDNSNLQKAAQLTNGFAAASNVTNGFATNNQQGQYGQQNQYGYNQPGQYGYNSAANNPYIVGGGFGGALSNGGMQQTSLPPGTQVMQYPNGQTMVQYPNGQTMQMPAGAQIMQTSNGQTVMVQAQPQNYGYAQQQGYGYTQQPQQQQSNTNWGQIATAGANIYGAATGTPTGNIVGAAASGYSIYNGVSSGREWNVQDTMNAVNVATSVASATNKNNSDLQKVAQVTNGFAGIANATNGFGMSNQQVQPQYQQAQQQYYPQQQAQQYPQQANVGTFNVQPVPQQVQQANVGTFNVQPVPQQVQQANVGTFNVQPVPTRVSNTAPAFDEFKGVDAAVAKQASLNNAGYDEFKGVDAEVTRQNTLNAAYDNFKAQQTQQQNYSNGFEQMLQDSASGSSATQLLGD